MVYLCFLANILCFLDRINISIAAPFMMEAFGWSKAEMGVIFSAFFAGYVLFMIPCGVAVDRFGAYRSMAAGMVWGSLFTCVTPFFSRIGSISLCRFLVGMGQGFNFPAVNQWIARHVGVSDRAKVQGFTLSGIMVASVIGFPAGSWIIRMWGWPAVFYVSGAAGLVWTLFWLPAARVFSLSERETSGYARKPIPWKALLAHPSALGLSLSYFCHGYAGYLFMAWLPTYLMQVHGFSLTGMGIGAALPALASSIFMNLSGWLSDSFVKHGRTREFSRKGILYLGMGGSGVFLLGMIWVENPYAAVCLLILSSASMALSTPVYWTLCVDMAPRHAVILSSIMNTSGNIAGVVAPLLTGWIVYYLDDWNTAIAVGAAFTFIGVGIAFKMIGSSEIEGLQETQSASNHPADDSAQGVDGNQLE